MLKPGDIKKFIDDMTPKLKEYGSKMMSGDKEGAIKIGKEMEADMKGVGDNVIKILGNTMKGMGGIAEKEIDRFLHVANKPAKNTTNTTNTTTQKKPQQQQIQEPKNVGQAISPKDMTELVNKIMPDTNKLIEQIKGGGGDKTEINETLLKIGTQLAKSGMDEDKIGKLAEHIMPKLTQEQIQTLTKASKETLNNPTQQIQTTDQTKEQTGIANMIKPEEIKGLVDKMLPDFENFAKQMESGNTVDAEKTGKDIELQLSKFGMDDKTMKMFTDLVGANTKLTEDQIKTLAKSSQVTEKNETQQQSIQQSQPQTESQTQEPKLSWMKQIDAFDKVTQGVAGETQTVTNSQVNDLNNQTVTATNNDQQQTNQSDYLIERILQAQPQTQIVEHKFEGTITIKVDAPPGVDSAYVTKTINDMVNSPAFTDKMIKSQEIIANNYGLTGGKVSAYNNTSGMGLG
jgi:hypothetical protein